MKFLTIFAFVVCITLALIADQANADTDASLIAELALGVSQKVASDCAHAFEKQINDAATYTVATFKAKKSGVKQFFINLYRGVAKFFKNISSARSQCVKDVKSAFEFVIKQMNNRLVKMG